MNQSIISLLSLLSFQENPIKDKEEEEEKDEEETNTTKKNAEPHMLTNLLKRRSQEREQQKVKKDIKDQSSSSSSSPVMIRRDEKESKPDGEEDPTERADSGENNALKDALYSSSGTTRLFSPRVRERDASPSILNVDSEQLARQLTLLDSELFLAIDCRELLNNRFMQPEESPTFTKLVQRFNMVPPPMCSKFLSFFVGHASSQFISYIVQTSQWVCSVILSSETAQERAKCIEHLIKVCEVSVI